MSAHRLAPAAFIMCCLAIETAWANSPFRPGIGPFSNQTIVVAGAVLAAWITARCVARALPDAPYKAAGGMLLDAAFWGFAAARLGYIVQWWEEYTAAPMSIIAIGDGGFSWWIGIPAAAILIWWRTRRDQPLRRPAFAGIFAGIAIWLIANGALGVMLRSAAPLPDIELSTLDERPVHLNVYAGRPVVLNLWASWCPPCRREMPAFEQAQRTFPNIAFVLVNQGETAPHARAFLETEGLHLKDVLLDPSSETMQALGSRGLPTTFFFDAQGRLVDTHLGEITMASLTDKVRRRFGPSVDSTTNKE